ncbi:hypothetical protein, partial [Calothrix rhizosoleniae]|uniref:hypothetical protein n=1 Tax=Calothrix rhizosoleniae TaxID=888997 RepID=UPI0013564D64
SVDSEITDDVVETATQTSEDVTTTIPTDTTPPVTDVSVDSEITDDVVETIIQTSDEDVTTTVPPDTTTPVADISAEKEEKNQVKIKESPAGKSSTQRTDIEANKGFGTNLAKKKSKATKKKKR